MAGMKIRTFPLFCLLIIEVFEESVFSLYGILGLVGKEYADENEDAADTRDRRQRLIQKERTCHDCRNGIQVNIIGGFQCSDFPDDPVPRPEAKERGDDAQKKEICPHLRFTEP